MTQKASAQWTEADGWFVADLEEAADRGPGPCVLSPLTASLPPRLADVACALPVGDANGAVLQAAAGVGRIPWVLAAVLAADPFRRADDLLDQLWNTGVRAVTNWPTVGVLGGELGAALNHSEFTHGRELALLARARKRGMRTAAVVATREQLRAALAIAPDMVLVVPGLATAVAAERAGRLAEVDGMLAEAAALAPGVDLRLYLHPLYEAELAPMAAQVRGVVRHPRPQDGQASP